MNYDEMINSAFIGLWSRGQESEQLRLIDFNSRDKNHLCVLKLAEIVNTVYGYDVIVKVGRIKGWFLKKWYKLSFVSQPKLKDGISIVKYIELVESIYGKDMLATYYNDFFNERKK